MWLHPGGMQIEFPSPLTESNRPRSPPGPRNSRTIENEDENEQIPSGSGSHFMGNPGRGFA